MPRLPQFTLDTVVFLYPTIEAAENGEEGVGGTGWLFGVEWSSDSSRHHLYVVSNWHVASDSPVVRVNKKNGDVDILDFTQVDWMEHKNGSDLAICPIDLSNEHRFKFHTQGDFLTQETIDDYAVGIGDKIYSVGRFVDIKAQKQNRPVVRFGNIALMPAEIIDGDEIILVEMRSRTGYSGSLVMVYIPPSQIRMETGRKYSQMFSTEMYGPWILGTQKGSLKAEGPEITTEPGAQSGMATVVPIQKLIELLEMEKIVKQREKNELLKP